MANLTDLTIAQLVAAMGRKEASAVEVADAHLKKLDEHRALNAFITETPDKARAMAKASDERRARGQAGLLEGVPLGDRKSTRLNSSHTDISRMPSSA